MEIILKLFPLFSYMYAYILLPGGIAAQVFGSLIKMNLSDSIKNSHIFNLLVFVNWQVSLQGSFSFAKPISDVR